MSDADDDAAEQSNTAGIRSAAVRSAAWTGTQSLLIRLLSLLTFIVLARLLTPRDYGIASLAGVFTAVLTVFAAGGSSQAVVQKKDITQDELHSLFWLSTAVGFLLTVTLAMAAGSLADFFSVPELRNVLWVLAPALFAIGSSSVHAGVLQRNFRFGLLARVAVSTNIVATVLGIAAAFLGAGYWALVIQSAIPPLGAAAVIWRLSGYRPRVRVRRHSIRAMFSLSRHFLGYNFVNMVSENADKFIVGRALGTSALGVYAIAYRIVFIALDVLSRSVQLVALPAFARMQRQSQRASAGLLSLVRLSTSVTFPLFALMGVNAESLVRHVFGAQWAGAVPALQVLCVYGALQALLVCTQVVSQALGSAATVLRLASVGTVVQIAVALAVVQHGVVWVAATFVLRAALLLPFTMLLVARASSTSGRHLAGAIAPPLVASCALVGACVAAQRWVVEPDVARLGVGVLVGSAAYVAVLVLLGRGHVKELLGVLTTLRGRRLRVDAEAHKAVPSGAAERHASRPAPPPSGSSGQ